MILILEKISKLSKILRLYFVSRQDVIMLAIFYLSEIGLLPCLISICKVPVCSEVIRPLSEMVVS